MSFGDQYINNKKVVMSGSLVAKMGDEIRLDPFPEESLSVYITVKLDNTLNESLIKNSMDEDGKFRIRVSRPMASLIPTVFTEIKIGDTEDYNYDISLILHMFGLAADYEFNLNYNILQSRADAS